MSNISRITSGFRSSGLLLGALSLAMGLGGCGAPEAEAPQTPAVEAAASAVPNLVASLRLQDGTQVDFHEPVAGHVIVIASAALPQLEGKIAPVALYESLSGTPAPVALVQAAERAALSGALRASQGAPAVTAAGINESKADAPQKLRAPGVGASVHALSAADFSASYCPSGSYNFYYCWTNRTGNGDLDISSVDWLRTYANAYRGQVLLSLSYRNVWGNWIQLASVSMPENTVKTLYTSDNDRYLVEISQASGDGYHWSTYGDK